MTDPAARPFERLTLRNVRCFRDATIELDPQVTVLLGENGSGKTTVVEALASLTSGEGEGLAGFPLARGTKSGEMALEAAGEKKPVALWSTRASDRRLRAGRHLFAYGRYRRVFYPGEPEPAPRTPAEELGELAGRADRRKSITVIEPDNHLLRDLSRYLIALHAGRDIDPRLDGVWQQLNLSLIKLGQGIEGIVMERGKIGYVPKVLRHGKPWEIRTAYRKEPLRRAGLRSRLEGQKTPDVPRRVEDPQNLDGADFRPVDDQVRIDRPEAERLVAEILPEVPHLGHARQLCPWTLAAPARRAAPHRGYLLG